MRASMRGGGGAYQASFLVGTAGRRDERPSSSDVVLKYLGVGPYSARGGGSGRFYSCAGGGATLGVDPGDVEALMRTRLFAREAGPAPGR